MPKCVRCSNSGLTLKLDFNGLCLSCHSAMLQELADLRAFHEEYMQIPNAKEESERILSDASSKAQQIISEAEAKAADQLQQAEDKASAVISAYQSELKDQVKEASIKLSKLKKDSSSVAEETKEFITRLLESALKDFAISPKHNMPFERLREISKTHNISNCSPTFVSLSPAKFRERAKDGYVVFDFETTGLYPHSDCIIEIGAIQFDEYKRTLRRYHTLVNPGKHIPAEASRINNIYDSDVASAPDISQVLPDFLHFIEGLPIIAHNADFDVSFLKEAIQLCKMSYPQPIEYGDSIKLAKGKVKLQSYSLSSVAEYFNINQGTAHRAIDDCETLGSIMRHLLVL